MELFYSDGLAFSCKRCSSCCRFDPGTVFLSVDDESALCRHLGMGAAEFEQVYCRWIPQDDGEQLSLKEKSNYDCIFWGEGGCTVYKARPLSCRTYPFWRSMLESDEIWKAVSASCPGAGQGEQRSAAYINECLAASSAQIMVRRKLWRQDF
jgi:Fe-S-cluster containining protein